MVPDERRDLGVAPALLLEVVDDTAVHESQHPWSPLTGRTCPLVRWSVAPSMPHFRQESRCLLYDNLQQQPLQLALGLVERVKMRVRVQQRLFELSDRLAHPVRGERQ